MRVICRRKSPPGFTQSVFIFGALPPTEPLIFSSCWKKSLCLNLPGEEDHLCIPEISETDAKIEEENGSLKMSSEKVKILWFLWLWETSRGLCLCRSCTYSPGSPPDPVKKRKRQSCESWVWSNCSSKEKLTSRWRLRCSLLGKAFPDPWLDSSHLLSPQVSPY